MPLIAPNTNPDVIPQPIHKSSGIWGFVAGSLASIVEILPAVAPLVPDAWKAWVPVIAFAAGVILNKMTQPGTYQPVPPPKTPAEIDAKIAAAVRAALAEQIASKIPPVPAP